MIYLITGNPGAKKTAYCVSLLEKVEIDNKVNISKNPDIYQHNIKILQKKDLLKELTFFQNETGTGDTFSYEVEILPEDYFNFLAVNDYDLIRPDYYFERSSRLNVIIDRIQDLHGDLGLKYILPVRTIYSNIAALRIDYVRSLVDDWRDCPDGSIIVIDEIQLVSPYSDTKDKTNPIVTNLSIHRHRGFDFYFITQSAGNLHVLIKDLVAVHYHVTCPFGWRTKIFQYGEFKANPNAVSVKLSAEQSFYFTPSNHIFKLYKSTTINTAKARPPVGKMVLVFGTMLFGICMFLYAIFGFGSKKETEAIHEEKPDNNQIISIGAAGQSADLADSKNQDEIDGKAPIAELPETITKEQMQKQLKLQEEHFNFLLEQQRLQLIMQYDTLQRQLIEHQEQMNDFYKTLELYKTMLPKDYKVIKNNPDLQVRGVIKMGDKCKAYNKDGVLMTLNSDQCNYYTEVSGRVWKNGQTSDNTTSGANLPPALTDHSTKTVKPLENKPVEQPQAQTEENNHP